MLVRDQLIERIVCGSLQPGLLNESQLAIALEVSRTPVREALLTLDPIVCRKDRGFELRALSVREAKEIYPLIGTLESLALDYLALPLPEAAVAELTAANARVRDAVEPQDVLDGDMNWHRTLLSFSRNRTICSLAEKYRLVISRYEYAYFSAGGARSMAVDDHDLILDLIRRGDLERAKEALKANWLRGADAIADMVEWM